MIKTVYRSEDYPVQERLDTLRDMTSQSVVPTMLRTNHSPGFNATIRQADMGGTSFATLSYSSLACVRTPSLIRRCDPEMYALDFTLHGTQLLSQWGRQVSLGSGDLVLYDSSRPFTAAAEGSRVTKSLLLHIPRNELPVPYEKMRKLLAVRLPARQGIGALIAQNLTGLSAEAANCTPADATRLGRIFLDLLTAFLAHHVDTENLLPPETRVSALLQQIDGFIERHLPDPRLTPAMIATANHISIRYLHRLFQHRDTTVAAHIRQLRLDRCRHDLADATLWRMPIQAIAARWGFTHQAGFSRHFRSAYGIPPRDYRRYSIGAPHTLAAVRPAGPELRVNQV